MQDDEFACIFENGPLDRQILWLKVGTTHWKVGLVSKHWPEPLHFPYVTYRIESVGNHPTGCKYRGVIK